METVTQAALLHETQKGRVFLWAKITCLRLSFEPDQVSA